MTCCKNFTPSADPPPPQPAPHGAVYSIRSEKDPTCVPWVGLIAPHSAEGACQVCGRAVPNGIGIDLLEGAVFTCGTRHYYEWWGMFLEVRLGFLRQAGEKAYSEMSDAISPTMADRYFREAAEAFQAAIAVARDLEQPDEVAALETRLGLIEASFRSQSA